MESITRRRLLQAGAATLASSAWPGFAQTADWPTKPVRIVVGYPAGGLTDTLARVFGEHIGAQTGQRVIVENKPGASGAIGATEVAKSPPDGYTMMFIPSSALVLNRFFMKDVRYDADKDFTLLTALPGSSSPLCVAAGVPANTLPEFIQYAQKKGGANVGSYGVGSLADMIYGELRKQYKVDLRIVQYKGEQPMWTDVASGALDAAFGSFNAARVVVDGGRARTIAVSRKRLPKWPDVPTFREQGAQSPAFDLVTYQYCCGPAGMSPQLVDRIGGLLLDAAKSPRGLATLQTYSTEPIALSPQASREAYFRDLPVWLALGKEFQTQENR